MHRHRQVHTGHGPAVAIGVVLLVVGGAALVGAFYLLARREPAEAVERQVAEALELPFDRPVIEDGTWVLECDAPARWDREPDAGERLLARLQACAAFVADGEFQRVFPGAGGAPVRLRVRCEHDPTDELRQSLGAFAATLQGVGLELEDPRGRRVALR